jgi:serine/threonine-protein kinase
VPRFEERESDEPRNIVVATDPTTNDSIAEGSTVTVYYSDGPEEVPDVVGETQEDAERILEEAGFNVNVVQSSDTRRPAGEVIQQSPEGGEEADEGDTVTIVVSNYEEPTEDPSESPSETTTESPSLPTESPSTDGDGP